MRERADVSRRRDAGGLAFGLGILHDEHPTDGSTGAPPHSGQK
jgi:hypothetical protein